MNNYLISRSALLKTFERRCLGDCEFCPHAIYSTEEPKITCGLIQCAPAVDAEPVRHGKWIDDMYFDEPVTRCTACKYGFAKGHKAERFRYCPHCGAKMRGDNDA